MKVKVVCLLLTIFFALLMVPAICDDVAMVVSGKGQAQLEDETWPLELAEMLPVDVIVKADPNDMLKLIHLLSDKEYLLPGNSTAVITADGIDGQNVSGDDLELVSGDLNLDDVMSHQTGAAYAGQAKSSPAASDNLVELEEVMPKKEKSYIASEQDDNFDVKREGYKPTVSSVSATPAPKSPLRLARKTQSSDSAIIQKADIVFALPKEVAAVLANEEEKFNYACEYEIELLRHEIVSDWTMFEFALSKDVEPGKLSVDFIVSEQSSYEVKFAHKENIETTMPEALRLERNECYAQAAVIWIKLAQQKVIKPAILTRHLQRLAAKMPQPE
jgi:hypothetical protein